MNLADTLLVSCGAYSCIFPNRAAALGHLFLSYGNGYEWVDGQLVDVCEGEDLAGLTASQAIAAIFDRRRADHERRRAWGRSSRKKSGILVL
jgi:hypothetical protein